MSLPRAMELKAKVRGEDSEYTVLICRGTGCQSSRSDEIQARLEEEIRRCGLAEVASIKFTGCHGFCQQGPIVVVEPEGVLYCHVKVDDATDIVRSHLRDGHRVERLLYRDPLTGETVPYYQDIRFYKKQYRIVLRNCGKINPEDINDYLAVGGYQALRKALLEMTPAQVIEEVKRSGLRGRGGAGFPTGVKWELCARSPSPIKYMICNADEGDPGAFMDRSTMEGDPHTVLEGMILAAYAIGAPKGFIYVRAEYPLAVRRLRIAIQQAREHKFLGEHILGSNFSFDVEIKEGAGAFVCGEETALIASIEGKRGMPRPRPPYPATSGLWGKPTTINNVETLASVPEIILRGADWYASIGTERSKGTKVFALTGKVANCGLVEVPMGTTLEEIIFEIGGGIPGGGRLKAAQTGGPIGGCIPAHLASLPIDYESLTAAGALMGSGGLVVMDDSTCMVDVARFFLAFAQSESCGKCVPCRLGTRRMLDILEDIAAGRGKMEDLDRLEELAETISMGSLCALGGGAPNPVISTLKHFRQEYEEHIKYHYCRAAVCKGLVKAPCSHTCPAGIDIPRYIRLIQARRYADALACILEANPLPSVCGRVCFHPCELHCRRGQMDEPVAINALKRFVTERGRPYPVVELAPPTGKHVAIVGSGPAGLTAAHFLARCGHAVTIFEALPKPGGMLRYGIPKYRLPDEVLDAEIAEIERLGVMIKTGYRIESVDELLTQGFDAVLLATGAHRGTPMKVPGENNQRVLDAARFLREVKLGSPPPIGNRVVVVGGGNSAIDTCRTSRRLGAREVTLVYRRSKEEMPAVKSEVEEALHEGVRMIFLAAPISINSANGCLVIRFQRMRLGSVDGSGRRRPEPIPGDEFELEADTVIAALGQMPELPESMGLKVTPKGTVEVDPDSLCLGKPGVFAAGDVVTGPASVVEAIGAGKRAASAIDRYLGGKGELEPAKKIPDILPPLDEAAGERRRQTMPCLPLESRLIDFAEVELGFSEEMALAEAARCLRCDLEER